MKIAWSESEIDVICMYYGIYNFEEDENILTYQERAILVQKFEDEWGAKIDKVVNKIELEKTKMECLYRKSVNKLKKGVAK